MFASMWVSGSTLCLVIALCAAKQVTLPDLGPLDGTTTLSAWTNRTIFQYQGIPYAEPPIGTLRFKRPAPFKGNWTQPFNATEFGPVCPQDNGVPLHRGKQDEDCLHINVYTPKTEGGGVGSGMPVMVYIHGGSFRVGSARNVLPNYLLEEDVVLAVPQYRLGPLGFLSLKTDDVPGNQGMLDVLLALEWVNRNIEHFGGDPSRVTLFGQSAGAAVVTFMPFSPLVKYGTIQRLIALGGSSLGSWAVDSKPVQHAQMIAAHANCTHSHFGALADCLRTTTVKDLLTAHAIFRKDKLSGGNHVVWNEAGDKSFLQNDPNVLLKEGNFRSIPMLGGVTKHECSFCAADIYDIVAKHDLLTSEEFLSNGVVPLTLEYSNTDDRTGMMTSILREKYFKDADFKNFTNLVPGIMDITGSFGMKAPMFTLVNEMSRKTSCYLYTFNYFGRVSSYGYFSTFGLNSSLWNYPFPPGVAHADELLYIFPQEYAVLNAEETRIAKTMVQYFTSFAATGVPKAKGSPDWPKVSTGKGPYMKVEKTLSVHDDFIDEYVIATREGLDPYTVSSSWKALPLSMLQLVIPIVSRYL